MSGQVCVVPYWTRVSCHTSEAPNILSDSFKAVLALHLISSPLVTKADLRPTEDSCHFPLESPSGKGCFQSLHIGRSREVELWWEKRNLGKKIKVGWSCPEKPRNAAHAGSCACPPSSWALLRGFPVGKSASVRYQEMHGENVPEHLGAIQATPQAS